MKNYIKPIMNITEFDYENVVTGSAVVPEPETVTANSLINGLAEGRNYTEVISFTF